MRDGQIRGKGSSGGGAVKVSMGKSRLLDTPGQSIPTVI